ncbi:uncharacterized protein LOC101738044 isoform X3 [Bombyx mori]|uniref:Uncharacterized protein n=1 Tax=Bombyx mori TaxID=7091 RepID=A0A8R2DKQ8_BOMMO|nr:uncharacterized protein LOC101738044 isoform X3 [Bombyx mori]
MLCLLLIQLLILPLHDAKRSFEYDHSWKLFNYDIDGVKYMNDSDYEYKEGTFHFQDVALEEHEKFLIRQNLIPYDFIYDVPQTTISIPRTRPGIPFTVNFIDNFLHEKEPMLRPFPNSKEGKEFTSVFNMFEDGCDRLWFVDTGYLDIPGVRKQVQPASLLLYNSLPKPNFQFRKDINSALLHNGITSGFEIQFRLEVEKYRKRPNETYEHYVDFLNSTNQLYDPKSDSRPRDTFNSTYYPNYEGMIYTRNFEGNILLFTNWNRNKLYCWNMDTPYEEENVDVLSRIGETKYRFSALDAVGSVLHGLMQRTLKSTSSKFNEDENNFWLFSTNLDKLLEGSKCSKSNQCTDYLTRRSNSQNLLFLSRLSPKYVSDSVIRNVENIWQVTGIMN